MVITGVSGRFRQYSMYYAHCFRCLYLVALGSDMGFLCVLDTIQSVFGVLTWGPIGLRALQNPPNHDPETRTPDVRKNQEGPASQTTWTFAKPVPCPRARSTCRTNRHCPRSQARSGRLTRAPLSTRKCTQNTLEYTCTAKGVELL